METLPSPPRGPHLRTIAMPRDANPSGDIFGGWTLSQMDMAGATFAVERAGGRVATVAIDAMRFLRPITVGDEVSCFCSWEREGSSSVRVKVETWTRSRGGREAAKVTEGIFTYVAVTEEGKPRQLDDDAG
jgi:acyl-CoA thioesterase YciA